MPEIIDGIENRNPLNSNKDEFSIEPTKNETLKGIMANVQIRPMITPSLGLRTCAGAAIRNNSADAIAAIGGKKLAKPAEIPQ